MKKLKKIIKIVIILVVIILVYINGFSPIHIGKKSLGTYHESGYEEMESSVRGLTEGEGMQVLYSSVKDLPSDNEEDYRKLYIEFEIRNLAFFQQSDFEIYFDTASDDRIIVKDGNVVPEHIKFMQKKNSKVAFYCIVYQGDMTDNELLEYFKTRTVKLKYRNGIGRIITKSVKLSDIVMDDSFSETSEDRVKQDIDNLIEYSSENIASSNPYNYINDDAYKDLVSIGMDSVYALTSEYSDVGGLQGYVAAIAVSDITGVDFKTVSEGFDTSDEFWDEWKKFIPDMPDKFQKLLNESSDIENDLSCYGIFGDALLYKLNEENDGEIEFAGKTITCDNTDIPEVKETDSKELEKAERYIEKF